MSKKDCFFDMKIKILNIGIYHFYLYSIIIWIDMNNFYSMVTNKKIKNSKDCKKIKVEDVNGRVDNVNSGS